MHLIPPALKRSHGKVRKFTSPKAAKSKFDTIVENISLDFACLLFCELQPTSLKTKYDL